MAHSGVLLCIITEVSCRSVGCYQLSLPLTNVAALFPRTEHRDIPIAFFHKVFLNGLIRPRRVADQDRKPFREDVIDSLTNLRADPEIFLDPPRNTFVIGDSLSS